MFPIWRYTEELRMFLREFWPGFSRAGWLLELACKSVLAAVSMLIHCKDLDQREHIGNAAR
ncbi:hypothetical protein D3C86_1674610 [compost metagenome]